MAKRKITVNNDLNMTLLKTEVELYFKNNIRRIYKSDGSIDFTTYNKHPWYIKIQKSFTGIISREYKPYDTKLLHHILDKIKQSKDVFESGVVYMKYDEFQDIMSRRKFQESLSMFLKTEFLVETNFRYYYIINPKRVIVAFAPNDDNEQYDIEDVDTETGEVFS